VNAPCPCLSGKKFKKCCGDPRRSSEPPGSHTSSFGAAFLPQEIAQPNRPQRPKATEWQRNPRLPCPCGSQTAYQECCEPLIKKYRRSPSLLQETIRQLNAGNLSRAEQLYRAHFVQYVQWVYEHTLPLVATKDPLSQKLVEIDVESLIDNIDLIAYCRAKLERGTEIIPFIDQAGSLIPFSGFDKHQAYLRASWLYIALGEVEGTRHELAKIGDILKYGRREALELYLDVLGMDISERQTIAIAESILSQAGGETHITVQYTAIKALALLQIGETSEALTGLTTMLANARPPTRVETSDQLSTVWQLAKAWALFGMLADDGAALQKANDLYQIVPETMLTSEGIAALQLDLGWLLRDQERFEDAVKAFRRSLLLSTSNVTQIHLAHALALSGKPMESRALLLDLRAKGIEGPLKLEYSSAIGALAIATQDTDLAIETASEVRTIVSTTAFWEVQKNHLLVELLDFAHRPTSTPSPDRQRRILRFLRTINEMLELKPNFFGLGLNVNKMIEKLTEQLGNQ
jgi:uncharacterized protein YchJ